MRSHSSFFIPHSSFKNTVFPQLFIERMPCECGNISENDEFHSRPRDGNVHSAQVTQKSYLSLLVTAHK